MQATESKSALLRKMDASKQGESTGSRSAAAALRLAMARAADDLFDLAVSVIGIIHSRVQQKALASHMAADRLLILLDGPDGATGAVAMDRAFLVALIQQQTMGQLTGGKPDDRPFTATDAALTAPLIDTMLARAAKLADNQLDVQCLSGYRFGAKAEDSRTVLLAFEADRFRVFDLTLEFGGGPQQGNFCLMLPEPPCATDSSAIGEGAEDKPNLGQAIELARADLKAVICQMKVPLAALSDMQPGDLLPLVQDHLARTELVTICGKKVAAGRLGQVNGMRALRLNETLPLVTGMREIDGFAAGAGVPPNETEDAQDEPMNKKVNLSSMEGIGSGAMDDQETDDVIEHMSPEEAAVEISALAGLSLDEDQEEALPATIE